MIRLTRGSMAAAARAAATASTRSQRFNLIVVAATRAFHARGAGLRFAPAADAERESRSAPSSSGQTRTGQLERRACLIELSSRDSQLSSAFGLPLTVARLRALLRDLLPRCDFPLVCRSPKAPEDRNASEAPSPLSEQQLDGATRARRPSPAQKSSQSPLQGLTPANLRPDPHIDDAINRAEGRRDFSSSAAVSGSSSTTAEVPQPITPGSDFDTVAASAAAPHIGEDFAAPSAASGHNRYEFTPPKAAAAMSEAPSVADAIKDEDATSRGKAQTKKTAAEEEIPVEYPGAGSSSSPSSSSSASTSSNRRPRKERSPFDPFSFLSSLPLPLPSTIVSQLPPPLRDLAKMATPENLQKVANQVVENVAGGMRSTAKASTQDRSSSASGSSSSSGSPRGSAADALGKLFPTPSNLNNLAATVVPLAAKGLPGLVRAMPSPTAVLNVFGHVTSPAAATKPWGAARSERDGESSGSGGSGSRSGSSTHTSSRPRGARRPAASKPLRSDLLAEMLRVDHAGEYGAQRIYDGQLFVLGAGKRPGRSGQSFAQATSAASGGSASDVIEEMRAQEIEHLRTLERLLPEYRVRPTALLPLWNIAGFALGAGSAMLGPKAAMACTVAVEDVITSHYNDQLRTLNAPGFQSTSDADRKLKDMIKKHRDDEEHHKAVGIEHQAEEAPAYKLMTQAIQAGCQAAIWISKKV